VGFGGLVLVCGYDRRIRDDPARPEPLSRVKQTGAVMPHGCVTRIGVLSAPPPWGLTRVTNFVVIHRIIDLVTVELHSGKFSASLLVAHGTKP